VYVVHINHGTFSIKKHQTYKQMYMCISLGHDRKAVDRNQELWF